MKYKEFTKMMENKGFKVEDDGEVIIVKENFYPVVKIYKDTTESYALNFSQFDEQPRKLRRFIGQACHELAYTDLNDREDRFYYVHNNSQFRPVYIGFSGDGIYTSSSEEGLIKVTDKFIESEHPKLWEEIENGVWELEEVE